MSAVGKSRVSVRLSKEDWMDLRQFVIGDLHNMDEECDIKKQMSRIMDTILNAVVRSEDQHDRRPTP